MLYKYVRRVIFVICGTTKISQIPQKLKHLYMYNTIMQHNINTTEAKLSQTQKCGKSIISEDKF